MLFADPGDDIVGQLKRDQGLVVHMADCKNAKRMQVKEPDRWIDVRWGEDINRRFDCRISVLVNNERGALVTYRRWNWRSWCQH